MNQAVQQPPSTGRVINAIKHSVVEHLGGRVEQNLRGPNSLHDKALDPLILLVGCEALGQSYLSDVKWPNKALSRCANTSKYFPMNKGYKMRFEEGQYVVIVVVMVLVMSDGSIIAGTLKPTQPCGRQGLGITTSVPQNLSTSIRRQVQFQLP